MRLRRYLDTILLRSALLAFCMTINCFTHFFFFLTTFPHTPSPISAIATRIFFSKLCPQFMDCQRPRIFRLSTKGVYILKKKRHCLKQYVGQRHFWLFPFDGTINFVHYQEIISGFLIHLFYFAMTRLL